MKNLTQVQAAWNQSQEKPKLCQKCKLVSDRKRGRLCSSCKVSASEARAKSKARRKK